MHFYKLEVDFAYIYLAIHIKKIKNSAIAGRFLLSYQRVTNCYQLGTRTEFSL